MHNLSLKSRALGFEMMERVGCKLEVGVGSYYDSNREVDSSVMPTTGWAAYGEFNYPSSLVLSIALRA